MSIPNHRKVSLSELQYQQIDDTTPNRPKDRFKKVIGILGSLFLVYIFVTTTSALVIRAFLLRQAQHRYELNEEAKIYKHLPRSQSHYSHASLFFDIFPKIECVSAVTASPFQVLGADTEYFVVSHISCICRPYSNSTRNKNYWFTLHPPLFFSEKSCSSTAGTYLLLACFNCFLVALWCLSNWWHEEDLDKSKTETKKVMCVICDRKRTLAVQCLAKADEIESKLKPPPYVKFDSFSFLGK